MCVYVILATVWPVVGVLAGRSLFSQIEKVQDINDVKNVDRNFDKHDIPYDVSHQSYCTFQRQQRTKKKMPYAVSVRDRCMYSHSLKFGDAPSFRTGCTAVVDAKLQGPALTGDGVLCDILAAQKALKNVLDVLDHADLDTLPGLEGTNTTVEVVAKFIFDAFVGEMNGAGAAKVTRVEIRVAESDVATASYYEENESGVL